MKKCLILIMTFVLVMGVFGCSSNDSNDDEMNNDVEYSLETIGMATDDGYIDVMPEEAKWMMDEIMDLVIIDVSPLYDAGHLPGAVNYPIGDGTLDAMIPDLDKGKTYLVYCHGDGPAIQGANALLDAGIMNVYRLKGNYSAWVDAGYSVEK